MEVNENPNRFMLLAGGGRLSLARPVIVGVLNVTPDSFSDGGAYVDVAGAVEHAMKMVREGADVIDVGGESTRPGAQAVGAEIQVQRTLPVIRELAGRGVVVSIDTTLTAVAKAGLDAGAGMVNDVSAGRDPAMFGLVAQRKAGCMLMHMQGQPGNMQASPRYEDVVSEVEGFLLERARAAQAAGVAREAIVLDPGIGFGKRVEHNLMLMANLSRLAGHGYPIMLGASRKSTLATVTAKSDGTRPSPVDLVGATCATTALGVAAGALLFRVHDVKENRQAADTAWAILRRGERSEE